MKFKTLINALDTIVDNVEVYDIDWNYLYRTDTYHMGDDVRIKKFRVYETEDEVVLMVTAA